MMLRDVYYAVVASASCMYELCFGSLPAHLLLGRVFGWSFMPKNRALVTDTAH